MWHDTKLLNAIAGSLFGLALLILFCAGMWWLGQRPMFTLRAIRVEGFTEEPLRRINPATVKSAALPRIKGNFFTANLDAVRLAFEAVPWVRRAAVRREWPNKLIVTLEEHVPLATWGEDGKLVSAKGDVFTANLAEAEEDGDLPEFGGPDGSEKEVVARYVEFNNWFAPLGLVSNAVQLSERYAWTVRLTNGMTVELGREQDKSTLHERVSRLISIYPQLMAKLQRKIESVDMRYPNGLALKAEGLSQALNSQKDGKKK
jgi:cell division protein FtsQ